MTIIIEGHEVKGHINHNPGMAPHPWEYWVGGGELLLDYGSTRTWIEAMEEVGHVLGSLADYDLHND